jgi:hypothetical protein
VRGASAFTDTCERYASDLSVAVVTGHNADLARAAPIDKRIT